MSSNTSSRFSDWVWSEEYRRYYCALYDSQNNVIEYQWEGGHRQAVQPQAQQSLPQTEPQQPTPSAQRRTEASSAESSTQRYYDYERQQWVTGSSSRTESTPQRQSAASTSGTYPQRTSSYNAALTYAQTPNTSTAQLQYTQRPQQAAPSPQAVYASPAQSYWPQTSSQHQQAYASASTRPDTGLPYQVQEVVQGKKNRYIQSGEDGKDFEHLDANYRRVSHRHQADFFVRGRVFKMLWTEPAGQANNSTRGSTHFSVVWLDEKVYSEIRRFVVVSNKQTFSQCIPVQTYRRKGATKQGLIIDDHAIIYSGPPGTLPPRCLPGEEGITKFPLRVDPCNGEYLDRESRINFGKPYAVEHNVKVVQIGTVAPEHIYLLDGYFKQAMGVS